MSPIAKSAILSGLVALLASCSSETGSGSSRRTEVKGETLVGRWSALPKAAADESPGGHEARGALGETIKFLWEFKNDQSCAFSSEVKSGVVPVPGNSANVTATWKVLEARGDTLTIEISPDGGGPAARATIVFESHDRCLMHSRDDEDLVLTRLP